MYKATEIFKYLDSNNQIPRDLIVHFDSQIRKIQFDGKRLLLDSLPKGKSIYFLPSHTNKKYRHKVKIKTERDGFLEIVLGKTVEKKEGGQFVTFYELEAEGKTQEIEKRPSLIGHFCKEIQKTFHLKENKVKKVEKNMNLESYKTRSPNLFKL